MLLPGRKKGESLAPGGQVDLAAVEIIGNLAEKVPPNPQHVSAAAISINSKPFTRRISSRGGRLFRSSLSP